MIQNILTGYNGSLMYDRLILYHKVILPRAIFNCELWSSLTGKYVNKLNVSLQVGLKIMLNTPNSTPNMALQLELKIMPAQSGTHYLQLCYFEKMSKMGQKYSNKFFKFKYE